MLLYCTYILCDRVQRGCCYTVLTFSVIESSEDVVILYLHSV